MIGEMQGFFQEVSSKNSLIKWEDVVYIFCNECGWSQDDLLNAEIPFILEYLKGRYEAIKLQERELQKNKVK